MANIEQVFFDLDGTLTDSEPGIVSSFKYALDTMGVDCSGVDFRRFLGPPLSQSLAEFFSDDAKRIDETIAIYREHYAKNGMLSGNRLYAGIPLLLKTLCARGIFLSVVTSKLENYAVQIVEHFKIDEYFCNIYGGTADNKRLHKTDILSHAIKDRNARPDTAVMVGDRLYDMEAASKTGVHAIGVLYGYGKRDELEPYNPLYIVDSVDDLFDKLILCSSAGE